MYQFDDRGNGDTALAFASSYLWLLLRLWLGVLAQQQLVSAAVVVVAATVDAATAAAVATPPVAAAAAAATAPTVARALCGREVYKPQKEGLVILFEHQRTLEQVTLHAELVVHVHSTHVAMVVLHDAWASHLVLQSGVILSDQVSSSLLPSTHKKCTGFVSHHCTACMCVTTLLCAMRYEPREMLSGRDLRVLMMSLQ